jgi:6-phosphogluconolactonase
MIRLKSIFSNRLLLVAAFGVLTWTMSFSGCGGSSGGRVGCGAATFEFLYLATGANGQGEILAFSVDPTTGRLSSPASFPAPQAIYEMRTDPTGNFLFASDFDAGAVRAYSVNGTTGALTEINGSPFTSPQTMGNGGPLAVSPDGKFLFFADASGDITTFSISAGMLTPTGTSVQDGNQPYQFAVDPSGKFLYVSNHSDFGVGDQFSVFAIDSATGALSAVAGSPFHFQSNSDPSGITIRSDGNFVYSALSNSAGVEGLAVDRATGALTLISGSPWGTGQIPEQVAITPSGKYLYVSTLGVGAIHPFSVDQSSGALTALPAVTGGNPTQMIIDRGGTFLYSSYPNFHQIAIYPIEQATGALGQPVMISAGTGPGALAIVQFSLGCV